jgi:hypothetical protein
MRKRCDPALDAIFTSEFIFSDQHMNTTIVIPSTTAQLLAKDIFFHPINFKIAEWLPVPKTNRWERVFGGQIILEEAFLRALWAGASPEFRNSVNIHPFVQELEIRHQRSVLLGFS